MKFNESQKKLVLLILSLVLIISNIAFIGLLARYYYFHHPDFYVSWAMFNHVLGIVAAIIILGFISTRLPQFRRMSDSSIYEISYLIVIGLLSIVVSFFNKSTNVDGFLDPFLEIFKVMSILLILLIIATKAKSFQSILNRKIGRKALVYCFLIFAIIGCISSMYFARVHNSMVTVTNLVVMISGLFAGPYVGIPVGVVSGGFRFMYGDPIAFPCMVSTVIAGIVGSLIYVCNDGRFMRGMPSVVLMFLYSGFSMLLIILLTPESISVPYVNDIYPLTVFSSVLGMILFRMFIKEEKTKDDISYEELRIRELENTMDEYEDKLERLEEEIEILKGKNDEGGSR